MKKTILFSLSALLLLILAGCPNIVTPPATYTVTYSGNGNTGGSAPVDSIAHLSGAIVTVPGNAGSLAKTGFVFACWNTLANGSGADRYPGSTFTMGSANLTLYAKWTPAGSLETILEPAPKESRLYSRPAASGKILVSLGLGPSLPMNEWSTWRIDNSDYLWLSFPAQAGKTYTVSWDDLYDGSSASDSAPFYNADIEVGAFLTDGLTRVAGWVSDVDHGYSAGVAVSVTVSQNVKLRIRPWHGGTATGGFGVRIIQSDIAASGTVYSWYLDGVLQTSIVSKSVMLTPSAMTPGSHRLVGTATRRGVAFSEEYSFTN